MSSGGRSYLGEHMRTIVVFAMLPTESTTNVVNGTSEWVTLGQRVPGPVCGSLRGGAPRGASGRAQATPPTTDTAPTANS